MNMEISHSYSVAESELDPRSFDTKPKALIYHRASELTIITETHFLELESAMGAWSLGKKKDASYQERQALWLKRK